MRGQSASRVVSTRCQTETYAPSLTAERIAPIWFVSQSPPPPHPCLPHHGQGRPRAAALAQPHGHPPLPFTDLNHGSWSWHCVPVMPFLIPLSPTPWHERGTGTSMRRMGSRAWCIRIPGCRIFGSLTTRSAAQQPSPVMLASGCRARPSLNPSTIVVPGCLRQPCMQAPAHGWIFYVHKRRCQLASYLLLSSQFDNLLGIASRRQVWRGKRCLCHANNSFVSFFFVYYYI